MGKQRLFLVGFMGSGKSTIGPLLGARLAWPFLDLDGEIEKRQGKPISWIFENKGEAFFRDLEYQTLAQLEHYPHCVASLGGGAFAQERNRRLTRQLGLSIFLDCPFEIILARCPADGSRPLFRDTTSARQLYQDRLPFYREADIHIDVESLEPARIVDVILDQLGRFET